MKNQEKAANQTRGKKFVSAVSSLHPIDLAALVMIHSHETFTSLDDITIILIDNLEVPDENEKKILTPRFSLPTPLIILERDEVYRQVFIPLDYDAKKNLEAINLAKDIYTRCLEPLTTKDQLSQVINRFEEAKKYIIDNNSASNPEAMFESLIQFIFLDVIHKKVHTPLHSTLLISKTGQECCVKALINIGQDVISKGGRSFKFCRGGYVEVKCETDVFDLRYGEIRESFLYILNSNKTVVMKINLAEEKNFHSTVEINNAIVEDYYLELRGPLHMFYQAQLGLPIDVPWYLENVTESDSSELLFNGMEAISPISTASRDRVSQWIGGKGVRLKPSGYSLLDFDHPIVNRFVKSICLTSNSKLDIYDDWRHLLENYPVSKQKALKHQGEVTHYCKTKLIDLRNEIKAGSVLPIINLQSNEYSHVPYLGQKMLWLMALNKYMRDCMATTTNKWNEAQLEELEKIGIIKGGIPNLRTFTDFSVDLIYKSRAWRQQIAISDKELEHLDDGNGLFLVQTLLNITNERVLNNITNRELIDKPDFFTLDKAYSSLWEEVIHYYKVVLALTASSLKANVWNCWLLMGPNDYISVCKTILNKRNNDKVLYLSSRLWEV